jgi:putative transposase
MFIQKCYRYRISPKVDQEQIFLQWSGCRRFVWNWALERRQAQYEETKQSISYKDLCSELVSLKKQVPWLKDADSQCLQQVLKDLDIAYKNFFQKRAKFPKRKKKYKTPNAFRIPQRVAIIDGNLSLPKIGLINCVFHRPIEGQIKSATIKQEATGHWYVTFVTRHEMPDVQPELNSDNIIGIDFGLDSFISLSDGQKVKAPKFYRKANQKIKLASRRLSRKQKGSRNRSKAKLRLAKTHSKIKQQRSDFLHKLSTKLVRKHDIICIEDLNISSLAKTKLKGHAKSWNDAAIGAMRQMLQYKTEWNMKKLIVIDRFFPSSQICHVCRHKQRLSLSDRIWTCPCCQKVHDRDLNASVNIRNEGDRLHILATQ